MAPIGWLWAPRDAEVGPNATSATPSGRSRCSPQPAMHPDVEPYRAPATAYHPDMSPCRRRRRSGASVEGVPVAAGRAEIVLGSDALAGKEAESARRTVRRGMEVGAADPVRIDVQLHAAHYPTGLQDHSQIAHRESRSPDIDFCTRRGYPETRAVNERCLTDGTAPNGRAAALAGRVDLPVVDQRDEILAHADHVRVHPNLSIPGSDGGRAIGTEHQAGGTVHQRPCGVAFAVVTAVAGAEPKATVEHGDHGVLLGRGQGRCGQRGAPWVLKTGMQLTADQDRVDPHDAHQE